LNETPLLSRSAVGRAEELRSDTDALRAGWPEAQLLRVNHRGQVRVGDDGLVFAEATELGPEPQPGAVFLGVRKDRHVWAVRVQALTGELADLRMLGGTLDDADAGLLTGALAMLNWHDEHRARGISPHRSGGHLSRPRRRGSRPAGPAAHVAAAAVLDSGRVRRGR
jgi:NAD+ diphosphatase